MMTLDPEQAQMLARLLNRLDPDADLMTDTAAMIRRTLAMLPAAAGAGGLDHGLRLDLAAVADELDRLRGCDGTF